MLALSVFTAGKAYKCYKCYHTFRCVRARARARAPGGGGGGVSYLRIWDRGYITHSTLLMAKGVHIIQGRSVILQGSDQVRNRTVPRTISSRGRATQDTPSRM